MFYNIFFNILGIFIFLFVFWKKLKDDYPPEQIFSVSFYILFLIGVAVLISYFFFPKFWFWGLFASLLIGIFLGMWRFRLRFYETYESGLIGILPWLSFVFLFDSMKTTSWYSFCGFLFIWMLVIFYVFLNLRYKSFSWYKSGKVGFAGLAISIVFFLVRMVVAIYFPYVLSLSGSFDYIISGLFSFIFFLLLFILSTR
jgi:hypothetical protein